MRKKKKRIHIDAGGKRKLIRMQISESINASFSTSDEAAEWVDETCSGIPTQKELLILLLVKSERRFCARTAKYKLSERLRLPDSRCSFATMCTLSLVPSPFAFFSSSVCLPLCLSPVYFMFLSSSGHKITLITDDATRKRLFPSTFSHIYVLPFSPSTCATIAW